METKKIQDYSDVAVTNLDPEKAKIVKERGVELQRLRKQVDVAIKKAEELGRSDMVKKLKARGQQLDTLLRGKTFKDLSDGGQIGGDTSSSTSVNSRDKSNVEDQANQSATEEENNKEEQGLETKKEKNSNDESGVDTDNEETQSNDEASTKPDSSSNNEEENNDEVGSENSTVTDDDTNSTGDKESTTDKADETADDSETENNGQQQTNQQQNSSQIEKDADTDQENSDNSDDSIGSDQADEDDPVKDIFNRPENTKQQLGSQDKMSKKEGRDPTIDEIIKELQSISPSGKRGVVMALKDILSNRKELRGLLREAIEDKALEDIDDEEFSDFVNTILDEINNVTPVTYSDPDERKVKVKQAIENNLETRDIEMEQEMQVRADKRRKRANQSELDKYVNYRPISEFYVDLYRTIADQVKQVEIDNQSYDEINPEYDDDVIMKADVTQYEQRQEKPSIDFFFDVSGSWEDSDVELGKRFVSSLKEFVDRDELELNMYYFSDIVGQDLKSVRNYGGTSAWTKILDTIKNNNAKNVVIMTDGDMDGYAVRSGQKCLVEGVVWYIWKIGGYYATGAQELPKYLKGMQGTTQYAFSAKDVN